jgi:hypothetical protein
MGGNSSWWGPPWARPYGLQLTHGAPETGKAALRWVWAHYSLALYEPKKKRIPLLSHRNIFHD